MSKEAARPLHIAGRQPQVHDIVVHSAFFILMNDDLFGQHFFNGCLSLEDDEGWQLLPTGSAR